MHSIQAVLFDLANTLLDRQTALLQVAQAFYNAYAAVRGQQTQAAVVSLLVRGDAFGTAPRHAFERA